LEIEEVIAQGGIPSKNEFVMQVTADVMDMPIKVVKSDQAGALGAAMFAATVAGLYEDITEAQDKMGSGYSRLYTPNLVNAKSYQALYQQYLDIGDMLADTLRAL
jgi:L-ribulokinase